MQRRTSSLDALVASLQQRYGTRAARRGDALPGPPLPAVLPSGFATLDAALPHGRCSPLARDTSSEYYTLATYLCLDALCSSTVQPS